MLWLLPALRYEPIDPVRVVSNHSTGTMGFTLAKDLARRGASVTLVTGPTLLDTPDRVQRVDVLTSAEMLEAVLASSECGLCLYGRCRGGLYAH